MAILRQEKRDKYTVIDNTVFLDNELSYKAKGLLCQMLSLPDYWDFSIAGLSKLASDGRDSVASTLKELEEKRYFRREQVRDGGKFGNVEYVVSEIPFTENPLTGNPNPGNPPQLNTKESITKESNTKDIYTDPAPKKKTRGNLHSNPSLRPTLEEVESYVREKNLNVDPTFFYEFFSEGEWLDSKGEPVKNWKQKLITWSNQNNKGYRSENTRARRKSESTEQKDYGDFSDFGKVDF